MAPRMPPGSRARQAAARSQRAIRNYFDALRLVKAGIEADFEPLAHDRPTHVKPGPAKVAILRRRLERGLELWHPQDVGVVASSFGQEVVTSAWRAFAHVVLDEEEGAIAVD